MIYIYIYIYACVCVCVQSPPKLIIEISKNDPSSPVKKKKNQKTIIGFFLLRGGDHVLTCYSRVVNLRSDVLIDKISLKNAFEKLFQAAPLSCDLPLFRLIAFKSWLEGILRNRRKPEDLDGK